MRKIVVLVLMFFSLKGMVGQSNYVTENLKLTPMPPNAASLGIYGAIPVGHYTGIPNIQIPLYEIDLDGKKIPISLSYHASGVRVSQEASWVGLGWSLNAGGCITKTVRGNDDFSPHNSIATGYYSNTTPMTDGDMKKDAEYEKFAYSRKDGESDDFHYNFTSYSGQMMFYKKTDKDTPGKAKATLIKSPKDQLDVSFYYSNNDDVRWEIYDADGYLYVFSKTDEATNYFTAGGNLWNTPPTRESLRTNSSGGAPAFTTSYYLDYIKSPKGSEIKFNYTTESYYTPIVLYEDQAFGIFGIEDLQKYVKDGKDVQWHYPNFSYSYSKITQQRLASIEFDEGKINFAANERKDLESVEDETAMKKLSRITIEDYLGNNIKEFEFVYSYLGSTYTALSCRLMLDKVRAVRDKKADSEYEFIYDQGQLPAKNSLATDHFGFYNEGKLERHKGPYRYTLHTIPSFHYNGIKFYGRSKTANPSLMQYGVLKSIKYPTGATTNFTYETHKLSKETNTYEEMITKSTRVKGYIHPGEKGKSLELISTFEVTKEDLEIARKLRATFKIGEKEYINGRLSYEYYQYHDEESKINQGGSNTANLYLRKEGVTGTIYSYARSIDLNELYKNPNNFEFNGELDKIPLDVGKYSLKLNITSGGFDRFGVYGDIEYDGLKTVTENKLPEEGGLRIKQIENEIGEEKEYRTFEYLNTDGSTSAVLITPMDYYWLSNIETQFGSQLLNSIFLFTATSPRTPFSYAASGSPVGYSVVTEYLGKDKEAGYTRYHFWQQADAVQGGGQGGPGIPSIPFSGNGLMRKKQIYDNNNKLIQSDSYTYQQEKSLGIAHSAKVYPFPYLRAVGWYFYRKNPSLYTLAEHINTQHKSGEEITTVTKYSYDNTYNLLVNESSKNSKGQTVDRKIKYPFDYTDVINKEMVKKHLIGLPIEEISLVDNKVVSATKTVYKDTLGMYLPANIYIYQSAIPQSLSSYSNFYSPKYIFTKYNNKGKLLEMINPNMTYTSLLWNDKSLYPLAMIDNARYSQVLSTFQGYDFTGTKTVDVTKERQIRDNLMDAHIQTYSYSPLIGVKSITDASGITTYYNYDPFGRLKETYIMENGIKKLLEVYDYNFREK